MSFKKLRVAIIILIIIGIIEIMMRIFENKLSGDIEHIRSLPHQVDIGRSLKGGPNEYRIAFKTFNRVQACSGKKCSTERIYVTFKEVIRLS